MVATAAETTPIPMRWRRLTHVSPNSKPNLADARKNAKTTDEKRILNLVAIAGGEAWLVKAKSDYKPAARQTTTTAAGEGKKNAAKPQSRVQQRIAELEAAHQKTE